MVKHYSNFNIKKKHRGSIILIGNFDGLHRGHQKLFRLAQSYKNKYDLKIGVINFNPMPKMFFNENLKNFRISNIDQKIKLISKLKVDFIITKKFDYKFSKIKSINFIKDKFGLKLSDCLVLGFSQGGMMTFELGHYSREKFGGLAILSGKILTEKKIQNKIFINTPLFISHGNKDDVLSVENFYKACEFLKENNFNYQQYLIEEDSHTISLKAIDLLQEFIKKNL